MWLFRAAKSGGVPDSDSGWLISCSSRSELRQQLSLHCFQLVACCLCFCSLRRATCSTRHNACCRCCLCCPAGIVTREQQAQPTSSRPEPRQTDREEDGTDRNIASAALPLCSESNILPTSCSPDYSMLHTALGTFSIRFLSSPNLTMRRQLAVIWLAWDIALRRDWSL